jgi:FkbM family methyltransferase
MLSLVGRVYRNIPYFRGKWRLIDFVFNKFQRHSKQSEVIWFDDGLAMECALSDEVQNNIWWLGSGYEIGETRFIKRQLKPGMIFYDVGANVGYYSLIASRLVGANGKVHAFEPVARQFNSLCANIKRNSLTNIVANKLIVSDSVGQMTINLGPSDNSGKASVVKQVGLSPIHETVEATTLDDYRRGQSSPNIDVIKIDTEGHELSVLQGAVQTLRHEKPLVLVEVKNRLLRCAGTSRDELFAFFFDLGYEAFSISNRGIAGKITTPQDGKLIAFQHPASSVKQ